MSRLAGMAKLVSTLFSDNRCVPFPGLVAPLSAARPGMRGARRAQRGSMCLGVVSASDAGWEPAFCDNSSQDESCGFFYRPAARTSSRKDMVSRKPIFGLGICAGKRGTRTSDSAYCTRLRFMRHQIYAGRVR